MKHSILRFVTAILFLFASQTLLADKPSWAGKGKPTAEQKEAHKKAMTSKKDDATDAKGKKAKDKKAKKQKSKTNDDENKEKNSENKKTKSKDDMKELDKGSEKGVEKREEQRKKWWNFFN